MLDQNYFNGTLNCNIPSDLQALETICVLRFCTVRLWIRFKVCLLIDMFIFSLAAARSVFGQTVQYLKMNGLTAGNYLSKGIDQNTDRGLIVLYLCRSIPQEVMSLGTLRLTHLLFTR